MATELGRGCEQRNQGRLIDVTPLRVKTTHNKIELIAEEAVVGVPREMNRER